MGKKKNKVPRITEEEYFAYVAGLKNDAALFDADGKMAVPAPFAAEKKEDRQKLGR